MPETPARGSNKHGDRAGDTRQRDDAKRKQDSNRETTTRSTAKSDDKGVIPGVRTVSSPPGEPYNDPEYGRS
jgi:hypothetical protein